MGTQSNHPAQDTHGIAWLAGEASGDYIASLALPEVEKRFEGVAQYGIGGERMRAAGLDAWHDIRELSVRGYVEVLAHLPRLLRLRSEIVRRISASDPRVFVGVDAPDFNLGVEQQLRRRGVPVVHYVSPSIWAWRPERIHQIRRSVDHMLLVFPFEREIYRRAGIEATFVGHPLASVIPMEPDVEGARRDFGLAEDSLPVVTVMPGSRLDEVKGCAPAFFGAVEQLLHTYGDMHVLIPAADEQARERIIFIAGRYPRLAQRMIVRIGTSHRMIEAADAVLVASGTATLECALYKKPMVVGYSMPALTGILMQRKALIRHVSLPNILMGENVVPEFLQYFCQADQIAHALEYALDDDARRRELAERFGRLHESLRADTSSLVADVLEKHARRRW